LTEPEFILSLRDSAVANSETEQATSNEAFRKKPFSFVSHFRTKLIELLELEDDDHPQTTFCEVFRDSDTQHFELPQLPYNNWELAFRNIPEVILYNFYSNPNLNQCRVDVRPFLSSLLQILTSDTSIKVNRMRLCFLLFASNGPLPGMTWLHTIWCAMRAEMKGNGFLQHTFEKAAKFLKHPQVRAIQAKVISQLLQTEVDADDLPNPPEICLVSTRDEIRGWPGIRKCYINVRAFLINLSLAADVVLADACTVVANIATHCYLRDIHGDFGIMAATLDAGRMTEAELFGGVQPDWLDTIDAGSIDMKKVDEFTSAAFSMPQKKPLPKISFGPYSIRISPKMGIDYFRRGEGSVY